MKLNTYLYTLRQKGYLAYEYNPFRNYQTDVDLYEVSTNIGKVLIPKGCAANPKNGEILYKKEKTNDNVIKWVDSRGNQINNVITCDNAKLYATAGSLIDLDTDKLNFDLNHPVDITIQPSYDGSVNLILNDDKNIPRIINSRFSAREKNTYEIVDRIGENDTNIYNSKTFDKDTSLYFQYEYSPKIKYLGFVNGRLKVGQYCFYFTYCDSDNNESDYIAETGLIPVFLGDDSNAQSMDGGIKNQESNKGIRLKLSQLDKSYNYLKVYCVRYFADYQQNRIYECKKLNKRFPINSSTTFIQITGNEEAEDLDPNILNITKFNPKSILTQAQCKNMLFFGNVVKNSDNYRELQDCALRISPSLVDINISNVDSDYIGDGYYNSLNMYNNVGYFNNEYYRFGIVFIYQNGTLSNCYNILGGDLHENPNDNPNPEISGQLWDIDGAIAKRNYIKIDDSGWIKNDSYYTLKGTNLNARGVCKIQYNGENITKGINFNIPQDVQDFLNNDLNIRGFFFVRQKRVPSILAQCYLLPMDEQLQAPVINYKDKNDKEKYFTECFVSQDSENRVVTNDYQKRKYEYKHVSETDSENSISRQAYAAICPDFLLNQPYFNQIFNGGKFKLQKVLQGQLKEKSERFYEAEFKSDQENYGRTVTINTVTEDVPTVVIQDKTYRLEIGKTEEVYRFRYAEVDNGSYNAGDNDFDTINKSTNIVRGKYSPYLAIYSSQQLETGCLYNIYQSNLINEKQEFQNRMDSSEPFYAISDRYNFSEITENLQCNRGDCYLNQFTFRLNRNFNDPSLPNNDQIIDQYTWRDHYRAENPEEWENISRSDVNAVRMGNWITFKLKSSYNYALRSNDHSYVSEEALMGTCRSYYPRSNLLFLGENKLPDSYLYNDAYRATLGYKCYFGLQDINYIKDTFSNRIQYSAISIQDSYKNNYRESLSTYFRDYSQEYGSIQKLVGFEGYLLVIFEHAIGIAVINERVLAGQGDGEPVFINTKNVLPEELTMITDTYGTQWPESVIKSEAGYVYGVDTISKKIWRVKEQNIELISDFKVNKFLIDNITLGERELYPTVGLRNVKTHYNNNKKDIMFTFYDDVYEDEENCWNLCYNELMGEFITFYSWVPSYSENIDTQYFSFDRNTSKLLSLLNKCNYSVPNNYGILLDNPVSPINEQKRLHYIVEHTTDYTIVHPDNTTEIKKIGGGIGQEIESIRFKLEKDHWKNYEMFKLDNDGFLLENSLVLKENYNNLEEKIKAQKGVLLLYITPVISETNDYISDTNLNLNFRTEVVAFSTKEWIKDYCKQDFYLHGKAGIFNVVENLYPTYWYGEFHPFEFEFVVNDKIGQQKIFSNLIIISNKAEPESFHFEIEGDNYEFSDNKRWMYYQQEQYKKELQNSGEDIIFNRKYTDVYADKYSYEQYYRLNNDFYTNQYEKLDRVYPILWEEKGKNNPPVPIKPTKFPLYYERIDTFNEIYDKYQSISSEGKDYQNLSGSEILWNQDLNQFNISTHVKNRPIDKVGRLRGNSYYKEGKWNVQLPSINYNYLDENGNVVDYGLLGNRKETRIRDKWIKIKVRYSGKNLAIIHSLITLYNISYS